MPAVNHAVGGRRLGKLYDPGDLGSELTVLLGKKLHAAGKQRLRNLPMTGSA
jgi:hypothetical protein